MKSNRFRLLTILALVAVMSLTLAACGGKEEPTPTPEPPVAVDTPVPPPPTDTPEPPPPTDTPVPPTETPEPEPEVGADFVPFESAEGGFTLRYPDGWFTDDLLGFAIFASAEELLDAPDPGEEGGVAMVIAGNSSEFEGDDPVAMLETTAAEMDISEDAKIIEGPMAITINGQDAATAVIQGTSASGTPLSAFLTIIVNGDRAVVVVAATPSETEKEFRPQFEAMTASIEVGEPTESVVETPDLPPSEGILLYGDSATGTVPVDGSSAWEFIGLEGEAIDIVVRPQTDDLDVVVDLLDETGASVLDFEIDDSFGAEELRNFVLPSSGTYVILLRGFAGSSGAYDLVLSEAGSATGSVEGVIGYGDLMAGSILSAEGATWTFTGKAGDFVDITVYPFDEFDLVVDVLDAGGVSLLDEGPVDDSFDTEFVRILRLPETGEYTIAITGYEGEIGDYEVSLDLSNGGQPGSIVFAFDTLEADETEGHAFPFTALSGEVVTFQVDPVFELDVVIGVYNDETGELLEEVDSYTGFEEMVFVVPEDGNYYFLVSRFEETAGDYDATLLGSNLVIFELAIGDGVIGRFSDDGIISYIYRGTAGDKLVVTAENNDELDVVLEIEDLDGNVLLQVDDNASGGTETLTYEFTEDMIVYIDVMEFFNEPGQFLLFMDAE